MSQNVRATPPMQRRPRPSPPTGMLVFYAVGFLYHVAPEACTWHVLWALQEMTGRPAEGEAAWMLQRAHPCSPNCTHPVQPTLFLTTQLGSGHNVPASTTLTVTHLPVLAWGGGDFPAHNHHSCFESHRLHGSLLHGLHKAVASQGTPEPQGGPWNMGRLPASGILASSLVSAIPSLADHRRAGVLSLRHAKPHAH